MLEVALPEGAVAHAQVCVTGYFDAEGETHYLVSTFGTAPTSTVIGLLELGKHDLLMWAERE